MATATDPGSLRANPTSRAIDIGVDRDQQIIRGVIIAEEGPFRDGRGEFDAAGIRAIRDLMARTPGGLKSRFSHPTMFDDGLGKFLGRMRSPRLVSVWRGGRQVSAVRADLHLSDTAFATPGGDLANYLLDLVEEDPEALGASLVLNSDQEYRLDARGRRLLGDNGEPLPPLWKPTRLYGCDVVDEGAATRAFLGFTSTMSARGFEEYMTGLLDQVFPPGTSRETVEQRARGWIHKYLEWRHPEDPDVDGYDPERDPRLRRERFHREHPEAERLLHPVPPPPFRATDEPGVLLPGIVGGLAAPFDQVVQEPDGSKSHYCPGCFSDCLARVRRGELVVRLLWAHNEKFGTFANTDDGTLQMYESDDGLRFRARLRDDENGRAAARMMLGGWLGVSAGYAIDNERLQPGGYRTLLSAELSEISLTTSPAFPATFAQIKPFCSEGHFWGMIRHGG